MHNFFSSLLCQELLHVISAPDRSNHSELLCLKGIPKNFAKFTGKHLCQSLFFNKVAGLRTAILFKKRIWYRCFPVNFAKVLRAPFL